MCHTCHDVSNPVLANVAMGAGTPETRSAASYFHVERTSSEFELSDYANPGALPPGRPSLLRASPPRRIAKIAICRACPVVSPNKGSKHARTSPATRSPVVTRG